jgi:hypothetical protein
VVAAYISTRLHVESIAASAAMPVSRKVWSAAGILSLAKAKRSRNATGAERWLKPMMTTEFKIEG